MVFSQMGNKIWKHSSDFTDVVCLVDGLDEIYRYKQQMVENIKNARGCYICTARENKFDINFDYEIRLKPLTDKQINRYYCLLVIILVPVSRVTVL
jgi:hypothetical protein